MKKMKEKEVLFLQSDRPIPYKNYKDKLEDDDIVVSAYDEGYYSENNSWNPFYFVKVLRSTLETDKEYEKRLEEGKKMKMELKNRRRETYLKLKEEFENDTE